MSKDIAVKHQNLLRPLFPFFLAIKIAYRIVGKAFSTTSTLPSCPGFHISLIQINLGLLLRDLVWLAEYETAYTPNSDPGNHCMIICRTLVLWSLTSGGASETSVLYRELYSAVCNSSSLFEQILLFSFLPLLPIVLSSVKKSHSNTAKQSESSSELRCIQNVTRL